MRSRSDLYKANAEACRHQAASPKNAAQKDRLLKLAEQWTNLAEQAKKDSARIRLPKPLDIAIGFAKRP
jgi:hypothetical protein